MSVAGRRLQALAGHDRSRGRPLRSGGSTAVARIAVGLLLGWQAGWLLGGLPGILGAVGVAAVVPRWLSRRERDRDRRRRQKVAADLPLAIDLLVVALRAGRPVGPAMAVVAEAVGGPLGADLGRRAARLALGTDAVAVWSEVASHSVLGPMGRAVVRASDLGAPLADALERVVDDLYLAAGTDADGVAHRVEVRSAGPLGLCFLPAFVLIGVAPTVLSAFTTVLA